MKDKVKQWRSLAEKWSKQTGVPVPLILATIEQESGGDPKATRHEPAYLKRYVLGSKKNEKIATECGLSLEQVATSYGLTQLMFPLAYGYGARSLGNVFDPDQNIRYCAAHLATLIKKCRFPVTDMTCIRIVAGEFNGAGSGSPYARNVEALYRQYERWLVADGH